MEERKKRRLQLIRKPDRDWNDTNEVWDNTGKLSYNSLENPIGIETKSE